MSPVIKTVVNFPMAVLPLLENKEKVEQVFKFKNRLLLKNENSIYSSKQDVINKSFKIKKSTLPPVQKGQSGLPC
jgi:hypothetical protein